MIKKVLCAVFAMVFAIHPIIATAKEGDTWISDTAREACVEYGELYDICTELLMAIIERESYGVPDAMDGGCYGLMQIKTRFHKDRMERLGVTDIFDERGNVLVGADFLHELFLEYDDPALCLMIYNGQPDAEERAKSGRITRYAKKILERSEELERLHGK